MIVDLVRLYRDGKRRGREEVREAKPDRGELFINTKQRYDKRIIIAGFIRHGDFEYSIPRLHYVLLPKLRGKNLLLEGTEMANQGGRVYKGFEQAWWCRLVDVELAMPKPPLPEQNPTFLYDAVPLPRETI